MFLAWWQALNWSILIIDNVHSRLLFAEYYLFQVSLHYLLFDNLNDPMELEFLFEYLCHCKLRSDFSLFLFFASLNTVVCLVTHSRLDIILFLLFFGFISTDLAPFQYFLS
jgi:hypothetical protein